MKSANQTEIKKAFTKQAAGFESSKMNFSNKEYLEYAVSKIQPKKTDSILEIAAGTCICGRALAPYVKKATCLDMTPAMLLTGEENAKKEDLNNIDFVLGDAAELPFSDSVFDIVLSRLAFHHFPDTQTPFAESVRVLRSGGKLVLIDMEAAAEPLRSTRDETEKMRDPSHVRNLSREEMLALFCKNGLTVSFCEAIKMPMNLKNWLDHTATPPEVQKEIVRRMLEEIGSGKKTGFAPYTVNSEIFFDQKWVLIIGEKI